MFLIGLPCLLAHMMSLAVVRALMELLYPVGEEGHLSVHTCWNEAVYHKRERGWRHTPEHS